MKYGFVIDNDRCIGCHACTVACKEEHSVPVGNFRTWVKYIEKGAFPNTRRHFAVLRCNQCEDAPCVTICPVTALYKRPDGIVDFNGDRCIGCKACMQACPYDALYINPDTNTAEKCNYCAHRVEKNLQPACVIVCPTQAIIAGDLDDPTSQISGYLGRSDLQVRKPEQGTKPKLFYVGADEAALTPREAPTPTMFMWSQVQHQVPTQHQAEEQKLTKARTVYNVGHASPWGWKVSLYLWTKSIAAGVFLIPVLALALGSPMKDLHRWTAPLAAMIFLVITGILLIWDLKRPDRFWTILFRPQWKSWLAIGTFIITGYGAVLGLWLFGSFINFEVLYTALAWPGIILAVFSAIYTGFLFAQAEGRDLWQSALMPFHLLVQATLAGSATLFFFDQSNLLRTVMIIAIVVNLFVILIGEVMTKHSSADAAAAMKLITSGPYRIFFWGLAIAIGNVLPLVLLLTGIDSQNAMIFIAIVIHAGLIAYEDIWIRAGQAVPLS